MENKRLEILLEKIQNERFGNPYDPSNTGPVPEYGICILCGLESEVCCTPKGGVVCIDCCPWEHSA